MSPNRLASVSSDDLATCVGCGLCLPHCPTFRVSGEEGLSPRGRIATMKGLSTGEIDFDATAVRVLDTCVQCRACEPACPSGVPYGRMIEAATTEMADSKLVTPWWLRLGLRGLRHHRLLLMTRPVLVLAQRLRLAPRRIGPGRLSWRNGPPVTSTASSPDIWVFTGCVMDVWQRHTHRAVADLAKLLGLTVATPAASGSCCGALHTHAGMHEQSLELARRTMKSTPGDAPIVVDSAGCGAALKAYGEPFGHRVIDAVEWFAEHMDHPAVVARVEQAARNSSRPTVVIQDPCHHRHVQKVHGSTRRVLEPFVDIIELSDDGLCCGAGGAYSLMHPDLAEEIRDRKVRHIQSRVDDSLTVIVASANPGCSMFLAQAGLNVRHPIDIVADIIVREGENQRE